MDGTRQLSPRASGNLLVEVAKRICETCSERTPCLEYALVHRIDHGVWGGTSERQRRRILKKRKVDVTYVEAPRVSFPSAAR